MVRLRIEHKDCFELMNEMEDNEVGVTLTSPPFKDEDVEGDYWRFYKRFMGEAWRVTENVLLVFNSANRLNTIVRRWPPQRTLMWFKNPTMYAWKYNPIFLYRKNPEIKLQNHVWRDVLMYAPVEKGENKRHEYQDPVPLYNELLRMFDDQGTVFDPFLGSGTTAVAAKQLGRDFVGCDIDAENVETARQRVSNTDKMKRQQTLKAVA